MRPARYEIHVDGVMPPDDLDELVGMTATDDGSSTVLRFSSPTSPPWSGCSSASRRPGARSASCGWSGLPTPWLRTSEVSRASVVGEAIEVVVVVVAARGDGGSPAPVAAVPDPRPRPAEPDARVGLLSAGI